MKSGTEKELDVYIKKIIKHTIINFGKKETRIRQREISLNEVESNLMECSLPFFLHFGSQLEEYFEDEKLARIIAALSDEKKKIIELAILNGYTSKELGKLFNKSDSRIRHILNDTLKEIKKKYEED